MPVFLFKNIIWLCCSAYQVRKTTLVKAGWLCSQLESLQTIFSSLSLSIFTEE